MPIAQERMIALLDTTEGVLDRLKHLRTIAPDLRKNSAAINRALATIARCQDIPREHPIWTATQDLLDGIDGIVQYIHEKSQPELTWYEAFVRERTHFMNTRARNDRARKAMKRLRDKQNPNLSFSPRTTLDNLDEPAFNPQSWQEVLLATKMNSRKSATEDDIAQNAAAWAISHAIDQLGELPPDTPEAILTLIERRKAELAEREDEEANGMF